MITKEMLIGDVIRTYPESGEVLLRFGMHCIGCMAARGESIADACAAHGSDADALIAKLNEYLADK